jgi:hypothetical protein
MPVATIRWVRIPPEQWATIIEVVRARGLVPFLDTAIRDLPTASSRTVWSFGARRDTRSAVHLELAPRNRSRCTENAGATVLAADRDGRRACCNRSARFANYSNPPTVAKSAMVLACRSCVGCGSRTQDNARSDKQMRVALVRPAR